MMLIISKIKHSHYVCYTYAIYIYITQVKSETSGDLTNGEYMNKCVLRDNTHIIAAQSHTIIKPNWQS